MLKSITNSCVKYVNNNWITSCKTSALISTKLINLAQTTSTHVFKTRLYKLYLLPISTIISTYKNTVRNLLNKSFTHYPQYLLLELLKEN